MSVVNWAKLVRQDRAKSYGTPWTEEELKAIYEYGIDPDKVRKGVLTVEELKEEKEREDRERRELEKALSKKRINHMKNNELIAEARFRGILLEDDIERGELMHKVSEARKKAEKEEE